MHGRARRGVGIGLAVADLLITTAVVAALGHPPLVAAVAGLLAVAVGAGLGLFGPRLLLRATDDLPCLVVVTVAVTVVVVVSSIVLVQPGGARQLLAPALLTWLVLVHVLTLAAVRRLRCHGRFGRVVIVAGTGPTERRLVSTLLTHPDLGLRPAGFVSIGEPDPRRLRGLPVALLGTADQLDDVLAETAAEALVVTRPGEIASAPAPAALHRAGLDLMVLSFDGPDDDDLAWLPSAPPDRRWRRPLDVVSAALALAVLVPLTGMLALLASLETGGCFVRHVRIADDGRPRGTTRLRTRRAHWVARPGTTWSVDIPGAARPIGRVLLATRLDRLPERLGDLVGKLRRPSDGDPPQPSPSPSRGQDASAPASGADHPQVEVGELAR